MDELDQYFNMLFGEDASDENEDNNVNESGDDDMDFDEKDLEAPKFDEGGSEDVDALLNSIETGDTGDDDGTDGTDLDELEKEYHITAAGGEGIESDPIDNEFPELDEACGGAPASECGGTCNEEPLAPLDPELDERGDQMLASIVTPDLAETMLSDDEYSDFIESGDASVAAAEGYLEESYVNEAMESDYGYEDIFNESTFAPEGKKYKMTKLARLRQLYQVSLQIEARLHKDPDYPRMQKVYRIRREIRQRWKARYHQLAMRRAKRYLKGLMKSKSNGITKIASRLIGTKK